MNITHARQISEWTANLILIMANSLLIWMVLTERNQHVKLYSKMIILAAIVDLVYVMGSFICSESLIISNGSLIYISNSVFSELEIDGIEYVLTVLFGFMFSIVNFIVPIEYYYQWHLVVREHSISIKRLVIIVLITSLVSLLFVIQFVYLSVRPRAESIAKYGYLLADPIFLNFNGQLPKFVANSFDSFRFCLNIVIIAITTISTFSVAIFFGIKTYQKLKSMKHLMSTKTLKLNRSMTNILIFKAISPLCLCTVPMLLLFIFLLFETSIPNIGFILIIATHWIPVLSPLSTLFLLQSYRRRLISTLMYLFKEEGVIYLPTSAPNCNQDNLTRRQSVLYHVS